MKKYFISKSAFGLVVVIIVSTISFQNCSQFKTINPFEIDKNANADLGLNGNETVPEPELNPLLDAVDEAPYKCQAPRYYQHVIKPGDEKWLNCSPEMMDVVKFQVNDKGRALARAQLSFRNNHTNQIYYWVAQVVVGDGKISYGVGDDICPDRYVSKSILGYGDLNANNGSTVSVRAAQGSSPCLNGQVSVFSGGIVEVWVEDSHPDCIGQDIGLVSTYDTMKTETFLWSTSMNEIVSLSVPVSDDRSKILITSSVEGTPKNNPNRICGQEAATLVSQVTSNIHGILDAQTDVIPASQGMGHLVLSPQKLTNYSTQMNTISLLVGSNTSLTEVFTGGCCGDAKLGFVKLK